MIDALIPARSGSSLKDKNIRKLCGYPLLAWSIVAAEHSGVDRMFVSTDSPVYAEIALYYGSRIILRPPGISTPTSTDLQFLNHFLDNVKGTERIVLLRPTTPIRSPEWIDMALYAFEQGGDSLRSTHPMKEPHAKCMYLEGDYYTPVDRDSMDKPRQSLRQCYHPNGYVDILKPELIRNGKLYGDYIQSFITENVGEVDTEEDFLYLEWLCQREEPEILKILRREYPNECH